MNGDSDVGDIVMLVTLWGRLIWDVGGRINLVTNTFSLQHPSPTSMLPYEPAKHNFSKRKLNSLAFHVLSRLWPTQFNRKRNYEALISIHIDFILKMNCYLIGGTSIPSAFTGCNRKCGRSSAINFRLLWIHRSLNSMTRFTPYLREKLILRTISNQCEWAHLFAWPKIYRSEGV